MLKGSQLFGSLLYLLININMQNNFDLKKFLIENKITTNSQKLDEFFYWDDDKSPESQRAKNKPQDVLGKRTPGQITPDNKKDYKDIVNKKGKLGDYYGNKGPKGPLPEKISEITVKGKKVKNYKQNGDKSYSVTFEDDTKDTIYVSHDDWDTLNNDNKKKI
jgi:hypothetical protein